MHSGDDSLHRREFVRRVASQGHRSGPLLLDSRLVRDLGEAAACHQNSRPQIVLPGEITKRVNLLRDLLPASFQLGDQIVGGNSLDRGVEDQTGGQSCTRGTELSEFIFVAVNRGKFGFERRDLLRIPSRILFRGERRARDDPVSERAQVAVQ